MATAWYVCNLQYTGSQAICSTEEKAAEKLKQLINEGQAVNNPRFIPNDPAAWEGWGWERIEDKIDASGKQRFITVFGGIQRSGHVGKEGFIQECELD